MGYVQENDIYLKIFTTLSSSLGEADTINL